LSRISETTTLLVITHHEVDDLLNEWMDEQRDPALTKSMVVDMALREFLKARGRMVAQNPDAIEDKFLKLVAEAFPDEIPAEIQDETGGKDFIELIHDENPRKPTDVS
jgi:hypothetical protein